MISIFTQNMIYKTIRLLIMKSSGKMIKCYPVLWLLFSVRLNGKIEDAFLKLRGCG